MSYPVNTDGKCQAYSYLIYSCFERGRRSVVVTSSLEEAFCRPVKAADDPCGRGHVLHTCAPVLTRAVPRSDFAFHREGSPHMSVRTESYDERWVFVNRVVCKACISGSRVRHGSQSAKDLLNPLNLSTISPLNARSPRPPPLIVHPDRPRSPFRQGCHPKRGLLKHTQERWCSQTRFRRVLVPHGD